MRYAGVMDNWRDRVLRAVGEDGRSDRAISLAARLGENFVNELRNTDKSPSVDKLLQLAAELKLSATYMFTGVHGDLIDEQLLALFPSLSEKNRERLLDLARELADR